MGDNTCVMKVTDDNKMNMMEWKSYTMDDDTLDIIHGRLYIREIVIDDDTWMHEG